MSRIDPHVRPLTRRRRLRSCAVGSGAGSWITFASAVVALVVTSASAMDYGQIVQRLQSSNLRGEMIVPNLMIPVLPRPPGFPAAPAAAPAPRLGSTRPSQRYSDIWVVRGVATGISYRLVLDAPEGYPGLDHVSRDYSVLASLSSAGMWERRESPQDPARPVVNPTRFVLYPRLDAVAVERMLAREVEPHRLFYSDRDPSVNWKQYIMQDWLLGLEHLLPLRVTTVSRLGLGTYRLDTVTGESYELTESVDRDGAIRLEAMRSTGPLHMVRARITRQARGADIDVESVAETLREGQNWRAAQTVRLSTQVGSVPDPVKLASQGYDAWRLVGSPGERVVEYEGGWMRQALMVPEPGVEPEVLPIVRSEAAQNSSVSRLWGAVGLSGLIVLGVCTILYLTWHGRSNAAAGP